MPSCTLVAIPGGGVAIVCGSVRRCKCGRKATQLCDWKVPAKMSGTCDRPICNRCATKPAKDKDLCPEHAAQWAEHPMRSS